MNQGSAADIYDVVVVGGGAAGAAAAIELARRERTVLLLERENDAEFKIGEALPPACNRLLRDLGVWENFLIDGHLLSYGNLAAWNQTELESADFIFDPNGHGWHLERSRFDACLRGKAEDFGATIVTEATLKQASFERGNENYQWLVRYSARDAEAAQTRCRWIIDASGRRGSIVRHQSVRRLVFDKLVACFAVFEQSEENIASAAADEDSRTLIEAVPDGWWYTALVPQNRRVVCYLTDSDLPDAQSFAPRAPKSFLALLSTTKHIKATIARHDYKLYRAPQIVSANSTRLAEFHGTGWLATGDAAMSFDPLSSQGILTGLYAGMTAGQTLNNYFSGATNSLALYDERLTTIFQAYLNNFRANYDGEKRWSEREFWRRRQKKDRH